MANYKVQLYANGGTTLDPTTSRAYVSATAGTGIKISGAYIRTSAIPQSYITNLTTSLNALQPTLSSGFGMYVSGATVGCLRYFNLQPDVTGGTVTLSAGCGYHIYANGAAVTLAAESVPVNQYGLDGHAMIYLTNSAYIKTTSNVALGTPLTVNAYNNCTLRFHDGHCIVDVEDTTTPA